jgi:hypothetical protein
VVVPKQDQDGNPTIVCDVWVQNQNNDKVLQGKAVCVLYRNAEEEKKHGKGRPDPVTLQSDYQSPHKKSDSPKMTGPADKPPVRPPPKAQGTPVHVMVPAEEKKAGKAKAAPAAAPAPKAAPAAKSTPPKAAPAKPAPAKAAPAAAVKAPAKPAPAAKSTPPKAAPAAAAKAPVKPAPAAKAPAKPAPAKPAAKPAPAKPAAKPAAKKK